MTEYLQDNEDQFSTLNEFDDCTEEIAFKKSQLFMQLLLFSISIVLALLYVAGKEWRKYNP